MRRLSVQDSTLTYNDFDGSAPKCVTDLRDLLWTCLQFELNFFLEREAQVEFLCFLPQRASERLGTGNEKRRTLKKSRSSAPYTPIPLLDSTELSHVVEMNSSRYIPRRKVYI